MKPASRGFTRAVRWITGILIGAALVDLYFAPNRTDLATYWALPTTIVLSFPPIKNWLASRSSAGGDTTELDRLANQLAEGVRQLCQKDAGQQRLGTVLIPVSWSRPGVAVGSAASTATSSTSFAPLPGLTRATQEQSSQGGLSDLHALYGGLGSGRLIIVGGPGSGKSGTAILLVLQALNHRQQVDEADRTSVPVPILLTVHGWDPHTQRLSEWLGGRLRDMFTFFPGGRRSVSAAEKLLESKRIALILDGLDEIATDLQPIALRALNEQASCRLVVLARSAEMAEASAHAMLDGAVAIELQDVASNVAADYLLQMQRDPPHPNWQALTDKIRRRPTHPLAQALSSPLMLTLARDTYPTGESLRELLDLSSHTTRGEIENVLLDRIVSTAYAAHPGQPPPRYPLDTAYRAFVEIAAHMNREGTRDLEWWRIPRWAPATPRVIMNILVVAAVAIPVAVAELAEAGLRKAMLAGTGAAFLSLFGTILGSSRTSEKATVEKRYPRWRSWISSIRKWWGPGTFFVWIFAVIASGLMIWNSDLLFPILMSLVIVVSGLSSGLGDNRPRRVAAPQWRSAMRSAMKRGLSCGIFVEIAILLALLKMSITYRAVTFPGGLIIRLTLGGLVLTVVSGFIIGLALELLVGSARYDVADASPLVPRSSWRRDQAAVLLISLAIGLIGSGWLMLLHSRLAALGIPVALIAGLTGTQCWPVSLTFVQLAFRWRTPLRLMRFLDDAHQRGVLRTIGPIYQFRHARLQDRLAGEISAERSRSG